MSSLDVSGHLCHLVFTDDQINTDASHGQFHLIRETAEVPTEVEVLLTSAVFYSFKHNETGLAPAAAACLRSCCPVTLQPRHTFCCFALPCPQPCPLPIYFLLPLTFHSSHACLLSEDRPLLGSPPHVQCDQYKGQGPCTRTPSLTKREGLKARGSAWPLHVPACARYGQRVCTLTPTSVNASCAPLSQSAGDRTFHAKTQE